MEIHDAMGDIVWAIGEAPLLGVLKPGGHRQNLAREDVGMVSKEGPSSRPGRNTDSKGYGTFVPKCLFPIE